jgi:hypothetical protein
MKSEHKPLRQSIEDAHIVPLPASVRIAHIEAGDYGPDLSEAIQQTLTYSGFHVRNDPPTRTEIIVTELVYIDGKCVAFGSVAIPSIPPTRAVAVPDSEVPGEATAMIPNEPTQSRPEPIGDTPQSTILLETANMHPEEAKDNPQDNDPAIPLRQTDAEEILNDSVEEESTLEEAEVLAEAADKQEEEDGQLPPITNPLLTRSALEAAQDEKPNDPS